MTLPAPNLDDRTWADLVEEGRGLIPRYAPAWTDFNAHDPGITLLELLAYQTELELFRLNAVGDAHRHAFLSAFGGRFRPVGARPASSLLVFDPDPRQFALPPRIEAGDRFAPWPPPAESGTALPDPAPAGEWYPAGHRPDLLVPDTPEPPRRPPLYRAAHTLAPTAIRLVAVQAFDGRTYRDVTDVLFRGGSALAWGDDPAADITRPPDEQPALYFGFDLKLRADVARDLTVWFVPAGSDPSSFAAPEPPTDCHPPDPSTADPVQAKPMGYAPSAPSPAHHGLEVLWEFTAGCDWRPVPTGEPFRDETRGLTRPGRVVLPKGAFPESNTPTERVIGAVPVPLHYVRCRLTRGRPDAPPTVRGVYPDAVLVEQWDCTRTDLNARLRTPERRLTLADLILDRADADGGSTEADVSGAAADLADRGWGAAAAGWAAWPFSDRPVRELIANGRSDAVPFVVLGVGNGEPGQEFELPLPSRWQKPGPLDSPLPPEEPPAVVIADSLRVWTMEPPWAWNPYAVGSPTNWRQREWHLSPDPRLLARASAGFVLDPERNVLTFGDGEAGLVVPPGAVVAAGFWWTTADTGNAGAELAWARQEDIRLPPPGHRPPLPAFRFRNPLPASGGATAADLRIALGRLAAEFAAPDRLVRLAEDAKAATLDGLDLSTVSQPLQAVTPLDFEALARGVPGTGVARARAWAGVDPALPGVVVPGVVTVVIVPRLPAGRPEPTPGLLRRVADHLSRRRLITCRVSVVGPDYQPVRVQATVHTTSGAGQAVAVRAREEVERFLHPLTGGPTGNGWPFGRAVHPGELLQVLAGVDGVRFVTGLRLAAGEHPLGEVAVHVPPRALVAARVDILSREDA